MAWVAVLYLIIINFTGLYLMYADKKKARKRLWRIPEKTLFLISILGGSLGSMMGMYLFRHKTKHLRFVIGLPLIMLVQIAGVSLLRYCSEEINFYNIMQLHNCNSISKRI